VTGVRRASVRRAFVCERVTRIRAAGDAGPPGHGGTHPGRPAVVEAVLATSDRRGFAVARRAAPLLRPLMHAAAGRLWRDDLAYAERRWTMRSTGRFPG